MIESRIPLFCLAALVAGGAQAAFESARWIGVEGRHFHWYYRKDVHPAPIFRKSFTCPPGVRDAVLAVSAAGYREVRLNGLPVADELLMPTPSNFDRRTYYSEHQVAGLLRAGTNVVEATLGNSIYNCSAQGVWMQDTITWRDAPQLLLEITADGRTLAATDETWETYADGPVRADSIRNGETYDARKEVLAGAWKPAKRTHGPGGVLTREAHPPVRIFGRVPMRRLAGGAWDAGENLAGFAEIRVRGEAGAAVTLRYREEIDAEGRLLTGSKFVESGEFQTDRYVLRGGDEEIWHPRFVYHGFRYVGVETAGECEVLSVAACKVGTDVEEVGDFTSSSEALNDIHRRMRRSLRANLVGFPTDCPTREKQGWTGDALYGCEAMLYNYRAESVYVDWLRTLVDVQRPNGQLPAKSPISANGYNWGYGPAWDSALALIPETIYDFTGDDAPFREFYPAIVKYLGFAETMLRGDLAVGFGLGDWLSPCATAPDALVSTAYLVATYRATARFARRFGKDADAARFAARAGEISDAFRRAWCREGGHVAKDEPASLAVAAGFGLAPDPKATAALLAAEMRRRGHRAAFGMIGSKWVPRVLADHGHVDDAMAIFEQREKPGWEWQRLRGATTIWEDFEGKGSHNHVILGDPSAWAFRYLGGIEFRDGKAIRHEPLRPSGEFRFSCRCRDAGVTAW
ncbi:MAG: family 78 glycoside hydrolase catalytic domain [Kiritimatiellae bacterium]|nr:family 78 glycoside hydrolase catalytic domain [Kiritimatiellia bacterium]